MRHENIFREARLIARHCVYPEKRRLLMQRTDECQEIFDRFNLSASREDMQELVAAWTRLLVAMDRAGPWVGGPPDNGGRLHKPEPPGETSLVAA